MKPGWLFLTTSKNSVAAVSERLFKHGKHGDHANQSSKHPMRLVHYGNGSAGMWGACGADSSPDFLVERLSWVQTGKSVPDTLRRAGPRIMGSDFSSPNRES